MLNLNGKQILAVVGAVMSVLMISSANLTDLLGSGPAKTIVTVAGLINMILQSVTVALSTQTQQIKDVAAMPGVERVSVNASASKDLAAAAVDPAQSKVGATTPDVRDALIAKAAS